ncbi:MAG TPA: DUF5937 family protein [Thermoleophilaceae bacterium]|jgi:hypothetical protein
MLVLRFGPEDLANVRFAVSPLVEVYRSVRALEDPSAQAIHLPWIAATRELLADIDLQLLDALQPVEVYSPDFIHPPPTTPLAELDDELAVMLATPAGEVREEVRAMYPGTDPPALLRPFVDEPEAALAELAALVRAYWDRALAPHWPRLRALLEGDVLHRARRMADGGAQRLFADIHPEVRFADDALWIEKRFDETVALDGRGLLFVPSAFAWPRMTAITEPPWQPTLIYPARGVGALWDPGAEPPPEALAALLGPRRASVLAALDAPRSTTEIARSLGLSAASVSQHLRVLKDAGLANGHRVGRSVLYVRSPAGDSLAG